MTPADYLATIVLPTLAEFLREPDDQRRAYLTCIVTAHMIDHVARQTKERPSKGRIEDSVRAKVGQAREFADVCLDIVEGISNGTKHAGTGRSQRFPFAPGYEEYSAGFTLGAPGSVFDQGNWGHGVGLVVEHEGKSYFIDHCVRIVITGFRRAYPDMFPLMAS